LHILASFEQNIGSDCRWDLMMKKILFE
jgi:hypothetical protein